MITRAYIANLLLPLLYGVQGQYKDQGDQWKEVYTKKKAKLGVERIEQVQYTGFAGVKNETMPSNEDPGMRQRWTAIFSMVPYGISVRMSREALDDNQYDSMFPQFAIHLNKSLAATKNSVCGLYLTQGFTRVGPDGVALFATNHPLANGTTFSNRIDAGLNETSMSAMMVLAGNMKSEAGIPIQVKLNKLVVAPQSQFAAERLQKSVFGPGNANNAVNVVNSMGMLPGGYTVNNFINPANSDDPNWFVTTNEEGRYLFQKVEPEFSINVDSQGTVGDTIAYAYERWQCGISEPRSILASIGS